MKIRSLCYFALLASVVAGGCSKTPPIKKITVPSGDGGSTPPDGGCPDCTPPPSDSPESIVAVRSVLAESCAPCHSGRGGVARGEFGNIFDVPDMIRRGLIVPNKPEESRLWKRIDGGEMPPADARDPHSPARTIAQLDDKQKDLVRTWIANGAPPLRGDERAPIASSTYLNALRADLRTVNPAEVPNTRYIGLHTYYNNPAIPQGELDAAVNAVGKLLNHLAPFRNQVTAPQSVFSKEGEIVALRINLRDYDLDADDWARIENATEVIDRVAFPCDVPLINADQFLAIASTDQHRRTDGTVESIYSNIVTRKLLEKQGVLAPGQLVFEPQKGVAFLTSEVTMLDIAGALDVDLVRNLENPNNEVTVRACVQDSGVSDAIRCIQRDAVPDNGRGFWWSMDFVNKDGAIDLANPFLTPIGPRNGDLVPSLSGEKQFEIDGGEAFWNWPNLMVGYALYNDNFQLISSAPQAAVSHPDNVEEAGAVENAISCFDCHSSHIMPMKDQMRLFAADNRALSAAERGFIEELFPDQNLLDGIYQIDSASFNQALSQTYLRKGSSNATPDGIFTLMLAFQGDLTMETVSAELFSEPDNVAAQVKRSEFLQKLAPTLTNPDIGFISRQDFVAGFKEFRRNIGSDDTLLNFCVQAEDQEAGEDGAGGADDQGEGDGSGGSVGDAGSGGSGGSGGSP
jgi:Planctomycete cytochrome C